MRLAKATFSAAAVIVVFASACGGNRNTGNNDAGGSAANTRAPAAKQSSDGCPLTAEQVSEVLGVAVETDEAACTYYPAGDSNTPNASFNRQHQLACDNPADAGYHDKITDLGVDSYVQPGTAIGTMILVCADDVFEITVDMGGDSAGALAAAKALAKLAL